jgi:MFS family permease
MKRYKTQLIFIAVALIGLQIYGGTSFVNSWQNRESWVRSEGFAENFNRLQEEGNVLEGYFSGNDLKEFTNTFGEKPTLKNIRVFSLTVRRSMNEWNLTGFQHSEFSNLGVSTLNTIFFAAALMNGFLYFFWDMRSRFAQFLFSSKFKRKDILKTKLLLMLATLTISFVVATFLKHLIIFTSIPSPYMNLTFTQVLPGIGWNLLYLIALTIFGMFFGIIMGQMATGFISLFGFAGFLMAIVNGIGQLQELSNRRSGQVGQTFISSINNTFLDVTYGSGSLPSWIWPIVTLICFSFFIFYSYPKITLDQTDEYLMMPSLRKPTLLIAIIGSAFIGFTNFMKFWTMRGDQWVELTTRESLTSSIIPTIVLPIIVGLVVYFFIYRLKGVQMILGRVKKTA